MRFKILERNGVIEIGLYPEDVVGMVFWRREEWKLTSVVTTDVDSNKFIKAAIEEQQKRGHQHTETMLVCHASLLRYGEAFQESQTSANLTCGS